MIRVAVADDHHAIRLGLRAALLDYQLPGTDGLAVCRRIKAGHTRDLFDAIRRVARGDSALPEISEPLLEAAGHALDPEDLPLLGMLVHRTSPAEIAATLRVDRPELDRRIAAMLSRLRV